MSKYLIENIRVSVTEGGMACGPVPGYVLAEVKYRGEDGVVRFRNLAEVDGTLTFVNTEESTFDAEMADEWEPDYDRQDDPAYTYGYLDYDEFYEDLPNREYCDAQLDKLLAYVVRADWKEGAEMAQKVQGKYTGEFEIPVCDAEQDYLDECGDE